MTPTVVCVLRSGGEYHREHVEALFAGVARWWPTDWELRMVALTDTPVQREGADWFEERTLKSSWPGWWAKMELFDPAHDDLGDMLYLDLDTIVVGDLREVASVNALVILRDFYHTLKERHPWSIAREQKTEHLNSGLMFIPQAARRDVWRFWTPRILQVTWSFRHGGDGEFLNLLWTGTAKAWQDLLPGQVVSYKVHVRPTGVTPAGARIVCFHGLPRPWQTPMWRLA